MNKNKLRSLVHIYYASILYHPTEALHFFWAESICCGEIWQELTGRCRLQKSHKSNPTHTFTLTAESNYWIWMVRKKKFHNHHQRQITQASSLWLAGGLGHTTIQCYLGFLHSAFSNSAPDVWQACRHSLCVCVGLCGCTCMHAKMEEVFLPKSPLLSWNPFLFSCFLYLPFHHPLEVQNYPQWRFTFFMRMWCMHVCGIHVFVWRSPVCWVDLASRQAQRKKERRDWEVGIV